MSVIPQRIERHGALRSYRLALLVCVVAYALMPITLLLQGFSGLLIFMFTLWIQALLIGTSGTATSMMITNNYPLSGHLATINGVAASCGCLAKTAGPALIGALYDKGVEKGISFVSFWTLGGVAELTLGLAAYLQDQIGS